LGTEPHNSRWVEVAQGQAANGVSDEVVDVVGWANEVVGSSELREGGETGKLRG